MPVLLYVSEAWTISTKYTGMMQEAEMQFPRKAMRCTRMDCIRNEEIKTEGVRNITNYQKAGILQGESEMLFTENARQYDPENSA